MNDKPIYVIAGGGHGKVVLDTLLSRKHNVAGIVDPALNVGDSIFGVQVVGGDEWINAAKPDDILLANGVGVQPGGQTRMNIYNVWKEQGFRFATVVHTTAIIGRDVRCGEGCQVMAGSVLQCGVSMGANVVINSRASIDHECKIGSHAFIGPGVVLCGDVQIGEKSFIGAGAVVLPGVRIGRDAIVGAGALINRPVPDGAIVRGHPATQTGGKRK
jgi:UDP-perosamine 4-acetyltransferase